MSFFGLTLMGKALDAFQYATNIASDDIANVNTPGASRQIVDFSQAPAISGSPFYAAHVPGTTGDGVIVSGVTRVHADSYDALFRGASASQNYYSVQQNQLSALQASFGEPNNGVNSYFTAFQTAVNQLIGQSASGASSARGNVLTAAQALTQALNTGASTIAQQKAQVMQQATSAVTTVNGLLDQIAALNGQIRASTAVGDSPNTIQDQRDQLIDQLSQYISTQTAVQADGSTLVTVNGQALVSDAVVYHLAAPVIGTDANGAPVFKVDFQSTPPAVAGAPGIPLGSGKLAAYADLYNNKLTSYGQQLDSFASSLATEVNRITMAGYDQNGVAGTALFTSSVASQPISASNIAVGITTPSQLPAGLASTAAGTLVAPMNSGNNTVDTSAALNGNGALSDSPNPAGITGTLTVTTDGVAQTFTYDTNTTDTTIDAFISHFNGAHLGVTASFDSASQRIVFARDPVNVDLAHRAAQQAAGTPVDPAFTITDGNNVATAGASLLGALGAANISGVTQNASNAFGAADGGAANALLQLFGSNTGVPAVQTTCAGPIAAGTQTIALPAGITNVHAGDVLTIDAQPGGASPQENVVVSSVSYAGGIESITATFANAHAGAAVSVSSAQVQTLGQYYGSLISQMGVDTQTAIAGTQSQSTLAQNIDQVRQGIDGINVDEETQNLIKYQNAYQAAARTVNVLNSMLGTVINNLGVGQGG